MATSRRPKVLLVIMIVVVSLAGWRYYVNRDFWADLWSVKKATAESNGKAGKEHKATPPKFTWPVTTSKFDLSRVALPPKEIMLGLARDAIPALTNPKMIAADKCDYLQPDHRVIGLSIKGDARAFPLKILQRHEIVNATIGKLPVAITYCPFCDSVITFDRRTEIGELEFRVSGLLYNSNLIMYSRAADGKESLWSQLKGAGVSEDARDKQLRTVPCELTTWESWRKAHPKTTVLAKDLGHKTNYEEKPYELYFKSDDLMFPVKPRPKSTNKLRLKDRVVGIWMADESIVYPVSVVQSNKTIAGEIKGRKFTLVYDSVSKSVQVNSDAKDLRWAYAYWFAWHSMFPNSTKVD